MLAATLSRVTDVVTDEVAAGSLPGLQWGAFDIFTLVNGGKDKW